MNIEWSKAPEGFPLWLEGTNEEHRKHSGWYRDAGQVFEGAYGGQWRAYREGQFFTVHRNPGPSNWTGEGLPPVGADVEVFVKYSHLRFDRFIGQQVHIVAHDVINGDPVAVFRMPVDGDDTEQDYHAMVAGSFRPIRTPEQIAEEEREEAITQILHLMLGHDQASIHQDTVQALCAKRIYDAGYRKQPSP